MKSKVIEDFERLLAQLNRGYTNVNYCGILQMISFILNAADIEKVNTIYEKLMSR